ncbi:MAG: NAD(P)-dependent alcohol dehydrogenase, partial [Cyclobacteriaceae bacterium]|nr:NAD(P)-dependent alcohol dehydrogenase [Cyclobacteriaceae bacterium]
MPIVKAYAATQSDLPLRPFDLERRDLGPLDVQIEILYCGVCHSDIHTA